MCRPPAACPEVTVSSAPPARSTESTCTCGSSPYVGTASTTASRGLRLLRLDRAVIQAQVTRAEAAERRSELLAR
jgi:hypothetical protein